MQLTNDLLDKWDRDHFIHPLTPLGSMERGQFPTRIVSTGDGVYITDRNGKRILDAFAGLFCVNVGYGRKEIAEAMAEQAHKLAYYIAYIGHSTEASVTLAHMVAERTPPGLNHVYFGLEVRTPTRRILSSCGTTTISSAVRKRRRSFRDGVPITARPSWPAA